jgi:hypothetical protein
MTLVGAQDKYLINNERRIFCKEKDRFNISTSVSWYLIKLMTFSAVLLLSNHVVKIKKTGVVAV